MKHEFAVKEITFANLVRAGTGAAVHRNRKSHGLALFLGGERVISFDGEKLRVSGNTVVYFPKGCNYTVRDKVPYDCYAINFQLADEASFRPFAFPVKNTASYLESFRQAQRQRQRKGAGSDAGIKAELYDILSRLQAEYAAPEGHADQIRPAVDYIHCHYDQEPISVETLAALCGISTVYLRKLFQRRYGTTPVRYINELRLTRAKELLGSRYHTVSQVCYLSGYRDESHFSREFKRRFHLSPREYAKLADS